MLTDLALTQPKNTPKSTPKSLGRWMLGSMAALLLSVGICCLWGANHLMTIRFDHFDVKHYEQELMRVNDVLTQNRLSFELQVTDYAHWDDTRLFVLGNNLTFIEENLFPESLTNIQVDGFIVMKLDGTLVTAPQLVHEDKLIPIPEDMWHALTDILPSLMHPNKQSATTGLFWYQGQAIIISGSTITDTFKTQNPNGYLFFMRRFDGDILTGLKALTRVNFSLQPTDIDDKDKILSPVTNNQSQWQVSNNLTDLPAKIQVQGGTHLEEERRLTFLLLALSAAGLILVSLAGIYWLIHVKVLKRLRLFSELANQYRKEPLRPVRWPLMGNDELDNLALSLNEFITEVEIRHKDLSFLAEHDPLTGIGNRRLLMDRLDATMNHNQHTPSFVSTLLLLDLDGFKLLNDGLGHTAGDDILKLVAKRILAQVRNYDTVVRLGGDEFAILLEDVEPEMARPFAQRLLEQISEVFDYNGHKLSLRASIGLTLIKAAFSKEDVIRNADLAMYEAKRLGKDQVVVFKISLLDAVSRRMQLEQALQEALNQQQLEVWFQPVIDASKSELIGMEALSRWSLGGEFVPPNEFIHIAESSGLIVQLGRQMLDIVGKSLSELQLKYPSLACNVNLSVRQFRDSDLKKDILDCVNKYQLSPPCLHLEITESMVAKSETDILPTMLALVDKGFKFHLDDFGIGYSSLERLRHLPFDTLKIDRSFITPLNQGDDVMVRNIINIGKELGMHLIAEGVETELEVHKLLQLGCTNIQGYYYAKPMPLHKLKLWLADNQQQIQLKNFSNNKSSPYIVRLKTCLPPLTSNTEL
jgi:diguanylate cyclase (GGDEF)-like protein